MPPITQLLCRLPRICRSRKVLNWFWFFKRKKVKVLLLYLSRIDFVTRSHINIMATIIFTYYHLKQNKLGRSLQWTSAKHCNECTEHWVGLCHEGPALLATTFPSFAIINIFATKVFTLHWMWFELTISELIVIQTETPFVLYCVKVVKKPCQRCAPILQI